ncbi:MAG: VOC family protein [Nitrospira sp.]|nr:VOC family protein [Nitrospira sp.]
MIQLLHHSTIVVDDIEKSLHFYRDILGFRVQLDQEMEGEELSTILGIPGVKIRIALLQVGQQETGLVGLLSFLSPKKEKVEKKSMEIFPHALVFVTDDIEEVYNRLKNAGEKPISAPVTIKISGAGSVKIFACLDPNGVLVEIDQFVP